MTEISQFLASHGPPVVFGIVFLEQIGLPLPSVPWLLAAGALSTTQQFSLLLGIEVAVIACLIANAFWFYLGRLRGNQVLGLLCRISLESDSCVHRTVDAFTRYGWRGVIVAKFLPGMNIIMPPLSGMAGTGAGQFLLFDGLGSLIYCGFFFLVGYFVNDQITQIGLVITHARGRVFGLLLTISALYITHKCWRRWRLLHELRMIRITVNELYQKLNAGETPIILDARSRTELKLNPFIISSAIHLDLDDFDMCYRKLPRGREIIVYCSCPNEVTSARVVLQFRRKGFTHVRPLKGGIEAWRRNHYPVKKC